MSITLSIVAMFALFLVCFSKGLFFKEKEKELPVQKEVMSDDTKTTGEEDDGQKDEHIHDIDYYTENYPEIYKEELHLIFGDSLQVGEKRTIEMEEEYCSCGYSAKGYVYDEWELTYQDESGRTFTVLYDNRGFTSLEEYQLKWMCEQLQDYYMSEYVAEYFTKGVLEEEEDKTYCRVHCIGFAKDYGELPDDFTLKDRNIYQYSAELYKKLHSKDTMIYLPGLDYDEIFEEYPLWIDFYLSVKEKEGTALEKENHEKSAKAMMYDMIRALNEDTDNMASMTVILNKWNGRMYDDRGDWRYYFCQGEAIRHYTGLVFHFGSAVYRAYTYKGIFW